MVGDSTGYWIGEKAGRRLFEKRESFIFKKKNLIKAEGFYEKHGGKAIVLARFMPIIRTFVPMMAGVAKMNYRKFVSYNVIGGVLWVAVTSLMGYFLGSLIPGVDKFFTPIILAVIVISLLPSVWHFWKENKTEVLKKLKSLFKPS